MMVPGLVSDQRVPLLCATLGFLGTPPHEREFRLLHRYANMWRGIGDIVAGMARHEYDVELRRYNGVAGARQLSSRSTLSIF